MYRATNIRPDLTSMVSHGDTRPERLPLEGGGGEERRVPSFFVVIATTLFVARWLLPQCALLFVYYLPTYLLTYLPTY
jgi:hypothetical protein